ncbi:MAG: aminotransferase class I/II-fold pyridoxal phosphate-dependent enzyme [Proteobacteria bacterium]|nr:aminotransferase class I/II-fold pyridoxal phosphate-dependent enzyme [Pseudomonadota bacterium]
MINFRTSQIIDPPIVEFKSRLIGLCNKTRVIDLCQAIPSYPMPAQMKKTIIENFDDKLSFYSEDQGIPELREEICKLHNVNGVNVKPSNILVTAGANQAAFTLFTAMFKQGDKVALPVPYYFNYDMGLRMLGVEPVYYFLDEEDNFKLKFNKLDENIFKTCKAFVIVNPNNPTGVEYEKEELQLLYNECKKNDVTLIADETYGFFSQKGYPDSSLLSYFKRLDDLVVVNTFSKSFSLTGFRVGYLILNDELMKQVMKVQDTVITCAPRISQLAALIGLRECRGWLSEKVEYVNSNVREFTKLFNANLKEFKLSSCGAFFAYVKHPYRSKTATQAAELIASKTDMMTLPGLIFGPKQESFLRLAFGSLSGKNELNQVVERFSNLEKNI